MSRGLLVLLVLLTACSQPEAVPGPTPVEDLGMAPTIATAAPSPAAVPTAPAVSPAPTVVEPTASTTEATTGSSPTPVVPEDATQPSPAAPPSDDELATAQPERPTEPLVLLAVADAVGDHGTQGPDWTDLRSVELVELGNDLRVTLRFGGVLPTAPPAGEVPLLGVDIGDDGHQLFVEGGGESWAAYLDTPEGFVPYPGTFELAGDAMVLQVPFNALGSPTRGSVAVFVEWSRDSGLVGALNPTSEDHLDGEAHTFDRNG